MAMKESGKRNHLRKLLNIRMAIVEVEMGETNEEAWLRHLSTHPEDLYANVRIFNRQKKGQEPRGFEIRDPKELQKSPDQ